MATQPKVKVKRTPQPRSPFTPLTTAQMNKVATQRVNAALKATAAPITSARQQAAAQAAADARAIQASGDAAAKVMGEAAPRTQQIYGQAAEELKSLGSGLAGAAGETVAGDQNANSEFVQQQVGAPLPGASDPTGLQNTLYGLGAYVPGSSLVEQGAAAGALAAAQPGIQAGRTFQDIQTRHAQQAQDDKQYEQQLLDLYAKRPDLRNQVLDELEKLEMSKLNARLSLANSERADRAQSLYEQQFGYKQVQDSVQNQFDRRRINIEGQNLKLAQQRQRQSVQNAIDAGSKINATASRGLGYLVDQYGHPVLDAQGKRIKVTGYSAGGKGGTKGNVYEQAVVDAAKLIGKPVSTPSGLVDPVTGDPVPGKYLAKPGAKGVYHRPGMPDRTDDPAKARHDGGKSFAEAQLYLMQAYNLTRARARSALIAAGWKPDGKRPPKK